MAYIGHSPTNAGTFYILDDLTMGSGTTYGLAVGGVSVSPSADNLLITLDGVIQHPGDAYTISGSNIVFASGPGSGVEFYGIIMGQSASTGQGSIGADELKVSGDGSSGQVLTSDGDGTFSWATDTENYLPLAGGTMTGNIVMGDDTSIGIADDAERIEFDGAGDISVLGANFGIGTASPATALHVSSASNSVITFISTDGSNTKTMHLAQDVNRAYLGSSDISIIQSWEPDTGNVGIGTASPDRQLTLSGASAFLMFEETGVTADNKKWEMLVDGETWEFQAINDALNSASTIMKVNRTGTTIDEVLFPSGNVGIGTTVPSDSHADANNLVIGTASGNNGMTIMGATGGYGSVFFADATDNSSAEYDGAIQYSFGDPSMRFNVGGAIKMFINSSGNVGIGTSSPDRALTVAKTSDNSGNGTGGALKVCLGDDLTKTVNIGFDSSDYGFIEAVDEGVAFKNLALCPTAGNVGIGTTSPASQMSASTVLEVKGSSIASLALQGAGSSRWELTSDNGDDFKVSRNGSTAITVDGSNNSATFAGDILQSGNHKIGSASCYIKVNPILSDLVLYSGNSSAGDVQIFGRRNVNIYDIDDSNALRWQVDTATGLVHNTTNFASGTNAYVLQASSNNANEFIVNGDDRYYMFNTWQTSWSDRNLKKNIASITGGLDICDKLNPVTFNWKKEWAEGDAGLSNRKFYGIIAQELQEVLPELVYEGKDKLMVQRDELQWILLSAIKELSAKVKELESA